MGSLNFITIPSGTLVPLNACPSFCIIENTLWAVVQFSELNRLSLIEGYGTTLLLELFTSLQSKPIFSSAYINIIIIFVINMYVRIESSEEEKHPGSFTTVCCDSTLRFLSHVNDHMELAIPFPALN